MGANEKPSSLFEQLAAIDVGQHIEKKGQFSYLSWPWAVKTLRLADPTATWEVIRFDGRPYLETPAGHFVEVAVTVQGVTLSQIHPVLDQRNRPISAPDAFQINTSIQRALVKAIALHGLGLYIYAGEDLPNDEPKQPAPKTANQSSKSVAKATLDELEEVAPGTSDFLKELADGIIARNTDLERFIAYEATKPTLTSDEQVGLWGFLPSNVRSAIKKEGEKPKGETKMIYAHIGEQA